ncbi:hypothetical protein LJK87_21870 [Paenibacillus sp. P25]|nr:hypothetical protein LJK87_21870 [Paenibacillus sp. P25]
MRVKKGACAPLRLSSMLSWPATWITSISLMTGVPVNPYGSLLFRQLLLHGNHSFVMVGDCNS